MTRECKGYCKELAARLLVDGIKNPRTHYCATCRTLLRPELVYKYRCACCHEQVRTTKKGRESSAVNPPDTKTRHGREGSDFDALDSSGSVQVMAGDGGGEHPGGSDDTIQGDGDPRHDD
ncbi:MAG: hypothetical protein MPK62_00070 [Alphaproteobacteria bacterium]|nr:hypothetical protein [Alphaproteobacteria bacterium]MDA8029532.1 hypothetical protein [Alphaproteobacteria bacterium]